MNETIKSAHLNRHRNRSYPVERFGTENAKKIHAYHKGFPGYEPTPLVQLNQLADRLGLDRIFIKDESPRFGLNAFKGLGGSYSIGRYIAEQLGIPIEEATYEYITSQLVREQLGDLTFVTATDGNHGRGVAWTAGILGYKSVVYMPKGSALERLENIRALGAEASITDLNYDDTVRLAGTTAEENGWVFVQDTSWPDYEKIPGWIMEGYTTMGHEIAEQLGGERPTHLLLQAGVGAMAGAMTAYFADRYGDEAPVVIVVEPDKADCIYRTAQADDGSIHAVKGSLSTIMAGLACGEPCTIGWDVLHAHADHFLSVSDEIAAKGMRILGNPLPGDPAIVSGESGAVTLGVIAELMQSESLRPLREALNLDANAKILCISTEGDTDQAYYRKIVWDGLCPA